MWVSSLFKKLSGFIHFSEDKWSPSHSHCDDDGNWLIKEAPIFGNRISQNELEPIAPQLNSDWIIELRNSSRFHRCRSEKFTIAIKKTQWAMDIEYQCFFTGSCRKNWSRNFTGSFFTPAPSQGRSKLYRVHDLYRILIELVLFMSFTWGFPSSFRCGKRPVVSLTLLPGKIWPKEDARKMGKT